MKDYLKILSFILLVSVMVVVLGYKHFDKPIMTCEDYMTEIHGDLNSCKGDE